MERGLSMKGVLAVSKKKINLRKEGALACFLFYYVISYL